MAVEQGLFAAIVLGIISFVVAAGFICYMLRHYCSKFGVQSQRNSSNNQRKNQQISSLTGSLDKDLRSYKTTTDEEVSQKLPTFDQILRQEERSSSLDYYPLKFPKSPARNLGSTELISKATMSTSRVHEHSQSQPGTTS